MKKLLIILFLLPIFSFAQENETVEKSKVSIGLRLSPDYSYRIISQNDSEMSDDQWEYLKNQQDSVNIPKLGYTYGLTFAYDFNDYVGIQTGIQYSNKGYRTISVNTVYDIDMPPGEAQNIFNFSYLEIPLEIIGAYPAGKLQVIAGAGAAFGILASSSVKTIPDKPSDDFPVQINFFDHDYNKFNITPSANLGARYLVSPNLSIRAQAKFRYSLLNHDEDASYVTNFISAGFNLGLFFNL